MALVDRLEWLSRTNRAIFYNKRRSFAMISGIILGTMLLSGIFIYTAELNRRNYQTVVESATFELRFDILEGENEDTLDDLADMIERDERIRGTTIIGRETDFIDVGVDLDIEGRPDDSLFGENVDISGPGLGGLAPVFVETDFVSTPVGERILETTNFEGTLSLDAVNSTVISRDIASRYRLEVGDVINRVNVTYDEYDIRGVLINTFIGNLDNVTVVGIFERTSGNAGLFGSLFTTEEMYLSFNTLENGLPQIYEYIDVNAGLFLAVKIDETQFSVTDPEDMQEELQTLINELTRNADRIGLDVQGSNIISGLLIPFQITSIFVNIFDILLALPVVILSLYLLFFGLEMSLEERRREIAIKKVQGADSRQIFSELRSESFLLFLLGLFMGYMFGIFGAWIIGSSIGFMQFEVGSFDEFLDFLQFDTTAVVWSIIVVGGILSFQVIRRGRRYIVQEVTEQIQRFEGKKVGFFRRTNLDIVLFLIGATGVLISILEQVLNIDLNLGFLAGLLINGLGPFFLWIGGALVGVRISKAIPMRLEFLLFSITFFKDIARIVQSGLRRRGDTDRLAIIIILTLSIATLAAAQGTTDETHSIRTLEWEVGGDMQVSFTTISDHAEALTNITGVEQALPVAFSPNVRVLSSTFFVVGYDVGLESSLLADDNSIGIWHSDSFSETTADESLQALEETPMGVYVSQGTLFELSTSIGETIELKQDVLTNVTSGETEIRELQVEILGVYDHAPGGIIGGTMIGSDLLVNRLRAVANNQSQNAYDSQPLNASRYLLQLDNAENMDESEINEIITELTQLTSYQDSISLYKELSTLQTSTGAFGIPGLLTMNFIISVAAALISTFTYSAIIMERRKHEFAVLRAIGAKRSQVYKVAIAENLLLVATSVIWGMIIGTGITYQFNGLFEAFGVFLGAGPLNRLVFFPWDSILIIGVFTTIGMLIATAFSVRGAAQQDLSIATRVV